MRECVSEVAHLREQIAAQYVAARLGLEGLNTGTAHHAFITARQERIGALHNELRNIVGEEAIAVLTEVSESLPDVATRSDILAALRYGLGQSSEETEPLCHDLQQAWKTIDMLREHLGDEQVRKMTFAPSSSLREIPIS